MPQPTASGKQQRRDASHSIEWTALSEHCLFSAKRNDPQGLGRFRANGFFD
jgi:hypothetical protein